MKREQVIKEVGEIQFKEVCELYGVTLEEGFELFTAIVSAFMEELYVECFENNDNTVV